MCLLSAQLFAGTAGGAALSPELGALAQPHLRTAPAGICASVLSQGQRLGQATVGRIYEQFTIRKAKERISLNCPLYLGIDEHTLHKGQRFCTTFCDLKNHRVFDVHPGRSEVEMGKRNAFGATP